MDTVSPLACRCEPPASCVSRSDEAMTEQDDFFPPEFEDSDSDWATGLEDDFDDLRQASAMSTDVYGDMEVVEESGGGGGGALSRFSAMQKLILALLFLILVVVYGAAAVLAVGLIG